ncbi:WhiB family transcriptional regulator [Nocardia vulneris]|uniref:WhiB family transcriptional regulator n=1 Tax=Nocardia TaxID=1817 RepID=UPI000A306593|nr:WhiB family transcriptional regulator [Nocardia brasiliensis]
MSQPLNLPAPRADVWQWQMHAACRGVSSSVFFHPEGERGKAREARASRAKEICRDCPVLVACRTHALDACEPFGIWGGMSESDRAHATRRREPPIA